MSESTTFIITITLRSMHPADPQRTALIASSSLQTTDHNQATTAYQAALHELFSHLYDTTKTLLTAEDLATHEAQHAALLATFTQKFAQNHQETTQ